MFCKIFSHKINHIYIKDNLYYYYNNLVVEQESAITFDSFFHEVQKKLRQTIFQITILLLLTVSLDISAAFDMVNHNLLWDRLDEEFGIIGVAKDWIGSYLSARQFFVRFSPSSSNMCTVSAGVPQGSVLGPALFTAYVPPIGRLIESPRTEFHAYTDDIYTALMTNREPGLERLSKCIIA